MVLMTDSPAYLGEYNHCENVFYPTRTYVPGNPAIFPINTRENAHVHAHARLRAE